MQTLLPLQDLLHPLAVFHSVCLGTAGAHRRALATAQHTVLDRRCVRNAAHLAPQNVQLPYQLALARAADGRVAGHVAHAVQIDGKAHRPCTQARRGQRGLASRVPRTDDGNIKFPGLKIHSITSHV